MMCAVATWLGRSWNGGNDTSSNGQAAKAKSTRPTSKVSWAFERWVSHASGPRVARMGEREGAPNEGAGEESGGRASVTLALYLASSLANRLTDLVLLPFARAKPIDVSDPTKGLDIGLVLEDGPRV
jgi:hypothetical protein